MEIVTVAVIGLLLLLLAVGVLGAVLRRKREAKLLDNGVPTSASETPERLGFNWGAFSLAPIWLLSHGRVLLGLALIGVNIIFMVLVRALPAAWPVCLILQLAICLYFGFVWNRIAWEWYGPESKTELFHYERWWNLAGLLCLGVYVIVPLVLAVAAIFREPVAS